MNIICGKQYEVRPFFGTPYLVEAIKKVDMSAVDTNSLQYQMWEHTGKQETWKVKIVTEAIIKQLDRNVIEVYEDVLHEVSDT